MKSKVLLQILVYKIKEVNHLRHTDINKTIYAQRKETIERVFVNANEKHGMRWTL